jgi:hypothetical protein
MRRIAFFYLFAARLMVAALGCVCATGCFTQTKNLINGYLKPTPFTITAFDKIYKIEGVWLKPNQNKIYIQWVGRMDKYLLDYNGNSINVTQKNDNLSPNYFWVSAPINFKINYVNVHSFDEQVLIQRNEIVKGKIPLRELDRAESIPIFDKISLEEHKNTNQNITSIKQDLVIRAYRESAFIQQRFVNFYEQRNINTSTPLIFIVIHEKEITKTFNIHLSVLENTNYKPEPLRFAAGIAMLPFVAAYDCVFDACIFVYKVTLYSVVIPLAIFAYAPMFIKAALN